MEDLWEVLGWDDLDSGLAGMGGVYGELVAWWSLGWGRKGTTCGMSAPCEFGPWNREPLSAGPGGSGVRCGLYVSLRL